MPVVHHLRTFLSITARSHREGDAPVVERNEWPGFPIAAAIASRQARARAAARKRALEETEAAWQREEAVVSLLEVELRALCATDPGMSLLTAVEYVTPDPAHRVALYRCCHGEDQSIGAASDLAFLERRAQAEGFQV